MTDDQLADKLGAWAFGADLDVVMRRVHATQAMWTPPEPPPKPASPACPYAPGYVVPDGSTWDQETYRWLTRDGQAVPFTMDWWCARMEASRRWETEGDGMGGYYVPPSERPHRYAPAEPDRPQPAARPASRSDRYRGRRTVRR